MCLPNPIRINGTSFMKFNQGVPKLCPINQISEFYCPQLRRKAGDKKLYVYQHLHATRPYYLHKCISYVYNTKAYLPSVTICGEISLVMKVLKVKISKINCVRRFAFAPNWCIIAPLFFFHCAKKSFQLRHQVSFIFTGKFQFFTLNFICICNIFVLMN